MKKIIISIIALCVCFIFLPRASANLDEGLVGYWPFNGNADDESGNGNHGTVQGATLAEDRFGNSDSAYNFDGKGDYINVDSPSNLPLSDVSRTITAWIKKKITEIFGV